LVFTLSVAYTSTNPQGFLSNLPLIIHLREALFRKQILLFKELLIHVFCILFECSVCKTVTLEKAPLARHVLRTCQV
jgi:hypothetical protein